MLPKENAHIADNGKGDTATVNSIFEQPWWLDAVAPGKWGEVTVSRGGEVIARMPYTMGRRCGLPAIVMPPFTQALGPWLRPTSAKYANQLGEQKQLLVELIEQLPEVDSFYHHLTPNLTNWLPFHWAGFKQTTRYTYRLSDLTDQDKIWSGLRENIRREVRKAQRNAAVRDDLGLEWFLDINRRTFIRQGMELPYDVGLLERVDEACSMRGARKMLFAEDALGRVHAAVYIVWDHDCAYYILGGSDEELRSSGAGSLVMWEAIKFASTVARSFDFKGSMKESIERFNRAFGAEQVPFHQIMKSSLRMRVLESVASIVRGRF